MQLVEEILSSKYAIFKALTGIQKLLENYRIGGKKLFTSQQAVSKKPLVHKTSKSVWFVSTLKSGRSLCKNIRIELSI